MERILRDNEKIRKAEEIYYRRNHKNTNILVEEPRKVKTYLGSKILLEMLVLILLAGFVFAVKNKDYIFTQEFLNSLASYNVNLTEKFNKIAGFFELEETTEGEIFENTTEEQQAENEKNTQEQPQETTQEQTTQEQSTNTVTDSVSLKSLFTFVKPIEGVVSSGFGARESQYQNVKGQHTGIDIAAESGTAIKAAMSGIVSQVSSEGDYGNHLKISRDNVITLYAHCQDIFVQEGQQISEGQEIASVGSTGNSTGPHLHFEIRIDNNPINPAEIIEF